MEPGFEPIGENEQIYRRIPAAANYYDPLTGILDDGAFAPHKKMDTTGISVMRSKYASAEAAALSGRPGKTYFVAELHAKRLIDSRIEIVPRPETPGGIVPAHAELPQLRSDNRKSTETLTRQATLVALTHAIHGPFDVPDDRSVDTE